MKLLLVSACVISLFLLLHTAKSEEELVRNALLEFISKLSNTNGYLDPTWGWNSSSYPCKDKWRGIICDNEHFHVNKIMLEGYNFSGVLDARILCNVQSLSESLMAIGVTNNNIHGENLEDIGNCSKLAYLLIGGNQFSGELPVSVSRLINLKILNVSYNEFSGSLPDLSQISGLTVFQAQDNQFSGPILDIDFSTFSYFNVSYNNLTGPIPDGAKRFKESSFIYNPQLCGAPLPKNCTKTSLDSKAEPVPGDSIPPPKSIPDGAKLFKESSFIYNPQLCGVPLPKNCTKTSLDSEAEPVPGDSIPPPKPKNGGVSKDQILMFAGYILIGLAILSIILLWLYKKGKTKEEKIDTDNKVAAVDDSNRSFSTVELKGRTEFSTASAESGIASSSLIVLTSPEVNGLKFEDLLQAPAELIGRGKHGSVYKVECGKAQGMSLAVKRIRDWTLSTNEFKQRMRRLDQVNHRNVLPVVAFYSSRIEKLIVYEYQQNGSLFKLIHAQEHPGNLTSPPFDWSTRLSAAAKIADALAFMHEQLLHDRIPHGNLKSSNIFFNKNMEPCVSEYGLMYVDNQDLQQSIDFPTSKNTLQSSSKELDHNILFKADTYAFGVILLELLTGRMVLNDGLDLASWVVAVLREEWTVEVFDRKLIREGASEERMVNVLQVAIKCVNKSPEARPSMKQVALAIRVIRDDDERSMDVSELSMTRSFANLL
ncbi:hypothetical protein BUALT_Bualt04G0156200 [Buddleja alternifolia]|uniref:Protein kinase domain-containing protein n=1 Tax=Buddleja alternifolia TaxID=168488 RepID=A0AAV6XP73_9LAMI|nr:hypothetical protein BUALT_Bualt04G0156200 [Buddleja alternifolia]